MDEQSYINLPEEQTELMGYYIAGFVEGEGCFSIGISKNKQRKDYIQFYPTFTIQLNIIDLPLIEKIKKTLQCGKIYYHRRDNAVQFKVYKQSDLINIIIPFFDKYQFHGNKLRSFNIFKEAMKLFSQKEHLTNEGRNHLYYLKEKMNNRE